MVTRKLTRTIAIGAAAIAIAGGAYGIVSATAGNSPATTTAAASASATSGLPASRGGGSNARSGPAAGGTSGTIGSLATSSFTLSTAAGQKVTVKTASSTTYKRGTSPAAASAVKRGASVVVLGTVDGTTITASQVILNATGGSAPLSAATVVPFQRGTPSTTKEAGLIPKSYSQGSGTSVNGRTAGKATEAALAAYPGGIVDRVVALGNGEYEVHNIGVNWPHHIFVDQSFKVVGAD